MGKAYKVIYTRLVREKHASALPRSIALRVQKAISEKLETSPEVYGVPLQRSLKGYWKLRVGDYRAVFTVIGVEVRVHAILHRSFVYREMEKLLRN